MNLPTGLMWRGKGGGGGLESLDPPPRLITDETAIRLNKIEYNYILSENKFVLAKEIKATKNFKSALAVLNKRW